MKDVRLNNGVMMPAIGFGVFQIPESETEQTVNDAIEVGYRKFDTAAAYFNEDFYMAVSEMNERKDTNYQRSQMMHGDGKPPVKQTGSASEARQRMIDRRMKKEEK